MQLQFFLGPQDGGYQLISLHRLENIIEHPAFDGCLGVFEIGITGDQNHRRIGVSLVDIGCQLQACFGGHTDVAKNDVGFLFIHDFHSVDGISCQIVFPYRQMGVLQHGTDFVPEQCLVVYNENGQGAMPPFWISSFVSLGRRIVTLEPPAGIFLMASPYSLPYIS